MIKTLTTAATAIAILASAVSAETYSVEANVTSVTINQSIINEYHLKPVCSNVKVPIYETRRQGGGSGDALAGMIIGGLIGKGATGNDQGAAVGAVIGGMVGAEGSSYQVVTGYQTERQCTNQYETVEVRVNDGYNVTYDWNGFTGTVQTTQRYRVGDTILINITMN